MNPGKILKSLEDINFRRKGVRIWFILVLTWSIIRSILVAHFFQEYGLSPEIYFLIDFSSSIPYAHASSKSLLTLIDKKFTQAFWWGLATVIMFYAPDIYILYISKKVPVSTYIGFAIILLAFSILTYVQWRESRNSRSEK